MQKEFAGWYSSMSLNADAQHTEKRWKAVETLLQNASREVLETLARIAFRIKVQMASAEVADLRAKLTGDLPPPGDEELSLLAAAALACSMDGEGLNAALTAIIVATTSCGGLRAINQPMNLIAISEKAMLRFSIAGRRRPLLEFPRPLASSLEKMEVTSAATQAAGGNFQLAIQSVTNSLNKVLTNLARRQTYIEQEFRKYTKVQDEELDILWWLLGGRSEDLQQDFSDISGQIRPLAIARELASLTKVLPGPRAVPSLLVRAGVPQTSEQPIVAAVQGMPAAWLATVLNDLDAKRISAATTPILFALLRRKEVDGADSWISAWSSLTLLDQKAAIGSLHFAEAAYREFALVQLG